MNKRLSKFQKEYIKECLILKQLNYSQIALELGFSSTTINNYAKSINHICKSPSELKRKYTINENYFDVIDSEDKAYFLGLLYADGYNDINRNTINLSLKEQDKEILEKLSICIESNKPLQYVKIKNQNHQNQYRLVVCSKYLSQKLIELGCVSNKTFKITFPTEEQVPKELQRHFLRGYFDGDGWIGEKSLCIVGTQDFCNSLDYITKDLNINSYIRSRHPERNHNIKMFEISGRNQCKKFFHYIYDNATIYLKRKFDKWSENQLYKTNASYNIRDYKDKCA
jgi:intein/homing endonuclease